MNKSYYAVTGRILFDDEDSIFVFSAKNAEDAMKIFEQRIIEADGRTVKQLKAANEGSTGVIVNAVLVSDSPITFLSQHV